MKKYIRKTGDIGVLANCSRAFGESVVHSGLAVTPAQMAQMVANGVPVSTTNAQDFYDGVENPSWDMPLERLRGVDPATLWQKQKDIRSKVINAHKNDVATYGD